MMGSFPEPGTAHVTSLQVLVLIIGSFFFQALRIRALKQIGFASGPDPCVSVSGPTPAMESPRILRAALNSEINVPLLL